MPDLAQLSPQEQRLYACWCIRNTPLVYPPLTTWFLLSDTACTAVEALEVFCHSLPDNTGCADVVDVIRDETYSFTPSASMFAARQMARLAVMEAAAGMIESAVYDVALAASWYRAPVDLPKNTFEIARQAQDERLKEILSNQLTDN